MVTAAAKTLLSRSCWMSIGEGAQFVQGENEKSLAASDQTASDAWLCRENENQAAWR
jgi:hypothetical protein